MFSSFSLSPTIDFAPVKNSAVNVYREVGLCTATRVLE